MKRALKLTTILSLTAMLALTGCTTKKDETAPAATGSAATKAPSKDATKLSFWTFNELHQKFFEGMAASWNKANPDQQIKLEASTFPYDDTHNKLLVALQSGTGAPDLSDIEISKFANYLKGDPQLVPINDIVELELNNLVKSRFDIYAKEGKYYAVDYHVGAEVIYYNKEILDKAGVNADDIKTWDDFAAAGKKVLEKTGKPMTTLEATEHWSYWPLLAQQGADFLDKTGKVTMDGEKNIATLKFLQQMVKDKIAVPAAGGFHHAEEHYGFMNQGGAASIWMPMWYMGRFTDYMPDLKGKVIIKPLPSWGTGQPRSAGMGGTGTVITKQSKNQELAKKFLAFAKISKEGNIEIWKQLGMDPIRTDVWNAPELRESNKFTDYFGKNIFDVLLEVKNEIQPVNIGEKTPAVIDTLKTTVMFKTINDLEDPAKVLQAANKELSK